VTLIQKCNSHHLSERRDLRMQGLDGQLVLHRLTEVEKRVDELEDRVNGHDISLSDVKGDLKEIRQAVSSLREDVLTMIAKHTDRTWKLIFGLVAALIVLAGAAQALKFLS